MTKTTEFKEAISMVILHPQIKMFKEIIVTLSKAAISLVGLILDIVIIIIMGLYFIFNRLGRVMKWTGWHLIKVTDALYEFICEY